MCLVKIVVEVYMQQKNMYKMFSSCVVVVAFQSVFYLKMHQNNFFIFLKIIFDISVSK
jgi:hypothetical protein